MEPRLQNPWVDRRVVHVRSGAARDYLLRHGWDPLDTADTYIKLFAGPVADSGRRITQFVPLREDADDYVRGMISLITNLAILEDRAAVDVLDEMLGVTTPTTNGSANGQPAATPSAAL